MKSVYKFLRGIARFILLSRAHVRENTNSKRKTLTFFLTMLIIKYMKKNTAQTVKNL